MTHGGRLEIRRRLGYLPQEPGFYPNLSVFEFVDYVAARGADRPPGPSGRGAARAGTGRPGRRGAPADQGAVGGHAPPGGHRPGAARPARAPRARRAHRRPRSRAAPAVPGDRVWCVAEEHTVVLSTHQTEDVAALCQRVVVVDGGRVHFDGTTAALADRARGRVWSADQADPRARAVVAHRDGRAPPHRRSACGRHARRAGHRGCVPAPHRPSGHGLSGPGRGARRPAARRALRGVARWAGAIASRRPPRWARSAGSRAPSGASSARWPASRPAGSCATRASWSAWS